MTHPLRIALVGCGQIADAHLQELAHVRGCEVVATCDSLPDLARQAAMRFCVPAAFEDVGAMVREARVDIAHITTPPHSHAPLAIGLLEAGVHVYVEKPFTVDAPEAQRVLDCAAANGRRVCVGHDQLFDPAWLRLEAMVRAGALGEIVHVDSLMGYDLAGPFGKVMFRDPTHWVHRLPGGLFQNNISHALYRVAALMPDEDPAIRATWFGARPGEPPSELRVLLQGQGTTAHVVFTSRARPMQRNIRILGTRGGVDVDFETRVLRPHRAPGMPGALAKIHGPWLEWRHAGRELWRNTADFIKSRQHYFAGMRELFTRFQASVRGEAPDPIPPTEILRVTRWMDTVFADARRSAEAA